MPKLMMANHPLLNGWLTIKPTAKFAGEAAKLAEQLDIVAKERGLAAGKLG